MGRHHRIEQDEQSFWELDTHEFPTLKVPKPTVEIALRELPSLPIDKFREARKALDEHLIAGTGLCISCKEFGPCAARLDAMEVMKESRDLPMRTPGLTRPELNGAKRVA
jgi:hypothetical protein